MGELLWGCDEDYVVWVLTLVMVVSAWWLPMRPREDRRADFGL